MGTRGKKCSVCSHRERAGIDLALARGVSKDALAKRYGLGRDPLFRHAQSHMPPQLRASLLAGPDLEIDVDRLRETESQSLLANIIAIRRRLFNSFDAAELHGDGNLLARIAGQLHNNLELTAKLLGDLGVGSTTIKQRARSMPAYVEMRVELVRALSPFPEARQAVARVLHTIEHKAADDITAAKRDREFAR